MFRSLHPMHYVLPLLLLALVGFLPAAEPVDQAVTAAKRMAWTWFGLSYTDAVAIATKKGLTIVRGQEDDPPGIASEKLVRLVFAADHVLRAQTGTIVEGASAVELISWLGLTIEEGKKRALQAGRPCRVVWQDGEEFLATMDYSEQRLNFRVKDGRIIAVDPG